MRLLGVKIQGGYSSEAHVFAQLLGHRAEAYQAHVLYHSWPGDGGSADTFERASQAVLTRVDVGQRPAGRGRSGPAKIQGLARFRASLPRLLRHARACGPDVVYSSQQFWDCAAASYIARRLDRPHVIHLHFAVGPWLKTGFSGSPRVFSLATAALRLDDPLQRLISCAHVVTVSDFIRQDAIRHGVAPDRVTAVWNAVAPVPAITPEDRRAVRRELCVPADAPLIGIVGRFDPDKGHADTFRAFAAIAPARPDAHLALVGEGPLRPALTAQAAAAGLSDRVHFTGQRADVPRLLGAMDIFAHPSRREPFGLAIAEASAAGLPVVAYAEGGVGEIVEHGRTGLLAPPGDVDALGSLLCHLLGDAGAAQRLGAAGRERVTVHFQPQSAAARFAALLRRVAPEARG